jgi:hypothetical protein
VVTGASAGIGRELARQLGARGHELWLVARRKDRLTDLASEIRKSGGREAAVWSLDLTQVEDRRFLEERMTGSRDRLGLFVNNAGFGALGPTLMYPISRQLEMIELNITALTELSYEAARLMAEKRSGGIINVASTASFQPVPYQNVYAATKAYVLSFTCALAEEVKERGVRVMALCPGITRTEFQAVAGITWEDFRMRHAMSAAKCAELGLRDFDSGRIVSITGTSNKIMIFASWIFPRALVMRIVGRMMKRRG